MLINKEAVSAIFTNFLALFNKAFDGAPSQWEQTAMKVPSSGVRNEYAWVELFPKMRKWLGDKVIKSLKAHGYTITNEEWEATIGVKKRDIETDNLGVYEPAVRSAGYSAKQLPDEIISDLKNNGFASLCHDGQYFYDSDHPIESSDGSASTFSNLGTAALSCASKALAVASYGAARAAIMAFKDYEGRPLGLMPDVLEVPPALEATAKVLLEADKLDDNSPNPFKGTARLIVNPRLTSTTAWFLHVTNFPIRPFVYQVRKEPLPVEQTGMDADSVFMRGEYRFGVEADCAGGYSLPQLSYGSTGAGA